MPRMSAENFPDFFAATRPTILTAKDVIVNLARLRGYPSFMHVRGQNPFSMARGGTSIEEVVKVRELQTFQWTTPGERLATRVVNVNQKIIFPWRQGAASTTWTDTEYNNNTRGGEKPQVKEFARAKRNDLKSEIVTAMDASFYARPDFAAMEGNTLLTPEQKPCPYSIFAFISEDPVRFAPPALAVAGDGGPLWEAAGTLLGRSRLLSQNYWLRNLIKQYTPGMLADPLNGIRPALQWMSINLRVAPVEVQDDSFGDGTELADLIIHTNTDGEVIYTSLLQGANDRTKRPNDMGIEETYFNNIPIVSSPRLDVEKLDQTIGTNATYQNRPWQPGQPRYVFQNKKHMRWVFNTDSFFKEGPVLPASANQDDTKVVNGRTDYNLVSNGFNRCGIVSPFQPLV